MVLPTVNERLQSKIVDLALAAFLFCFAMLLYWHDRFFISWDLSGYYLPFALNIEHGNGFSDGFLYPFDETGHSEIVYYRAGFKLLLAGILWAFDNSLSAIAWFIEIVSALLVVLIFALGRRLYDWRVGLVAAVLFGASPNLIFWIPRHIDPFGPVLVIGSLLFFLARTAKYESILALISGLLAAIAVLIKSSSLLFLPAPLLLVLLKVVTGGQRRLFWFYGGAFLPLLIWYAFLKLSLEPAGMYQYSFQLNMFLEETKNSSVCSAVSKFLNKGFVGLYRHFTPFASEQGLFARLPLLPLMLLSLVVSAIMAFKGKVWGRVLLIIFMLYLPLMAMAGYFELRLSQDLLGIAILHLCLAATVVLSIDAVLAGPLFRFSQKASNFLKSLVITGLTACLLVVTVLLDDDGAAKLVPRTPRGIAPDKVAQRAQAVGGWLKKQAGIVSFVRSGRLKEIKLRGESLAAWLDGRLEPNETVMIDHVPSAGGLFWCSDGVILPTFIPYWLVTNAFLHVYNRIPPDKHGNIFVVTGTNSRMKYQNVFFLLDKKEFERTIVEKNVRYIALCWKPSTSLASWLEKHPGIKKIAEIHGLMRFRVFEVSNDFATTPAPEMPLLFEQEAVDFLKWLYDNDLPSFMWHKERILMQIPLLNEDAISSIMRGQKSESYEIVE